MVLGGRGGGLGVLLGMSVMPPLIAVKPGDNLFVVGYWLRGIMGNAQCSVVRTTLPIFMCVLCCLYTCVVRMCWCLLWLSPEDSLENTHGW